MRTRDQVSAQKLRGGFYTPEPLVHACFDRIAELLPGLGNLRILEPSAGDGAFIKGLSTHRLSQYGVHVTAIELLESEADKARRALHEVAIDGSVSAQSFFHWAASTSSEFDAAVGNPPFVRFQFVSRQDRAAATRQLEPVTGSAPHGVSNLWIPMLLRALTLLRPGGAFAFVVPAEILTGISANLVRAWLRENANELRLDLFEPGSFPAVLQEVVVLSGIASSSSRPRLNLVEHRGRRAVRWTHTVDAAAATWTRYLLRPLQLEAYRRLTAEPPVRALGELARFEVSIVTGANDFFTVDQSTVANLHLDVWARPLLPRIRHAAGLRYDASEHAAVLASGARSSLLDFSSHAPDPEQFPDARHYLEKGVSHGIADRYKCRIRRPWYRIPSVRAGALMLSKRSHGHPRMVVNEAGVLTTDTIYRGTILPRAANGITPYGLVAGFHSSLTMLGAEIEGRSFGGGVLELVPTEISRLPVIRHEPLAAKFDYLDSLLREEPHVLIEATDNLAGSFQILDREDLRLVADARIELAQRRLLRNELGDRSMPIAISEGTWAGPALAEVS